MSMQVEMVAEAIGEEQEHVTTTPQAPVLDKTLIAQLVGDAQASGLGIDGENGLLAQLTKIVLESALAGEITAHVGYEKHVKGASTHGNARNGTRSKTVLTKGGPVARCRSRCRGTGLARSNRWWSPSGSGAWGRSRTSCCRCRRAG